MAREIPPPPPADADMFTMTECAGYLRVTVAYWTVLRKRDPRLPQPIKLSDGTLRYKRSDLAAYVDLLPRGWSTMGGLREGAFGRRKKEQANG